MRETSPSAMPPCFEKWCKRFDDCNSNSCRSGSIALNEGYTTSTDPVVEKIQKFLALARQNVPFLEAAARVELPFEVIEALAEMGLQAVDTTFEGGRQKAEGRGS